MGNYEEAKRMYLFYNGSHFFMERNGDIEKYKSFEVPKEMEKLWDKDIKYAAIEKIKNEKNVNILRMLCAGLIDLSANKKDIEGLIFVKDLLIEKQSIFDTFTQILIIEALIRGINEFRKTDINKMLNTMIEEVICILKNLQLKTITVSKDYYINNILPEYAIDDKLSSRISDDIQECVESLKKTS